MCASPGRDRDVDEKKMKGEAASNSSVDPDNPDPPDTQRGRKRGICETSSQT